ncbi:lipase family protein [Actinomadura yumaensis]|uniref:lipase family protein n=1 Tax=Actinomadura yumaensis TaxID=111807 RepID=UPI00360B4B43
MPVLQYHSKTDEIVNYNQASLLHDDYCALGMNVTWKPWENLSHITLVYRGNADAMAFIADRLAGKPAAGDCPAAKRGG